MQGKGKLLVVHNGRMVSVPIPGAPLPSPGAAPPRPAWGSVPGDVRDCGAGGCGVDNGQTQGWMESGNREGVGLLGSMGVQTGGVVERL